VRWGAWRGTAAEGADTGWVFDGPQEVILDTRSSASDTCTPERATLPKQRDNAEPNATGQHSKKPTTAHYVPRQMREARDRKRLQATYSAATVKGVADKPATDPTALSPFPAQETKCIQVGRTTYAVTSQPGTSYTSQDYDSISVILD
jgi:hypothetical protein